MTKPKNVLLETVKYWWRRITGKKPDPFNLVDDILIDHPRTTLQRRAFVRAGCVFPVDLSIDGGPEGAGALLNLSGSGVLFVTKLEIPLGARFEARGVIYGRDMTFRAQVARLDPSLDGFESLFAYGANFLVIAERDRRVIVRAIFRNYRHLRDIDFGGLDA